MTPQTLHITPQTTPPPQATPHITPPARTTPHITLQITPPPQIRDDDWWKYESVTPFKPCSGDDIRFVEGLPSSEDVDNLTSDGRHHVIVLDDVMQKVVQSPDMVLLFMQGCHHKNLSVIFITQNLFAQGKSSRNIALNTTYLVLLKNVRDASQAALLGRQLYPGKTDRFMCAYAAIMSESRGYLIIDLALDTPDEMRLRTRVFIGEDPIVYAP